MPSVFVCLFFFNINYESPAFRLEDNYSIIVTVIVAIIPCYCTGVVDCFQCRDCKLTGLLSQNSLS